MSGKYKFRKSIASLNIKKQNEEVEVPAALGITIGGEYLVEVPNRDGYHYARIRNDLSELVQVYNDQTSPVYGLPVVLIRDKVDKTKWRVKGRDLGRYNNWGTSAYLPRHGAQHSFDPSNPGADPVWVWGRQMMPLGAIPSGSSGAGNVLIEEGIYYRDGAWHFAGGTGTISYLGYKPTDNTARLILTYIDVNDNPQLLPSPSYIATNITGTMQIVPHIPNLPSTSDIPIAVVRLVSGTSSITWSDIYDLRPWIVGDGFIPTGTTSNISIYDNSVLRVTNPVGISFDTNLSVITSGTYAYVTATGSSGGGGHTIQEDGVNQTARSNLNFVGSGFEVYDDAGNDATIVSGTALSIPSYGYPAIFDDSTFKVSGTTISYWSNLSVSVTGTTAYINAIGDIVGLNGTAIYDSSSFVVTGSSISFDSNLTVAATGTTAYVSSSGGGSAGLVMIGETTSDGSSGTMTVSSIPGTYKNLVVDVIARSQKAANQAEPMYLSLNGDTTDANYRRRMWYNTTLHGEADDRFIGTVTAATATASEFAQYRLLFLNYADTTHNHGAQVDGIERRAAATVYKWWGFIFWESTSAITSISVIAEANNFVSGSVLRVWGETD